jgi:hypothetical protein
VQGLQERVGAMTWRDLSQSLRAHDVWHNRVAMPHQLLGYTAARGTGVAPARSGPDAAPAEADCFVDVGDGRVGVGPPCVRPDQASGAGGVVRRRRPPPAAGAHNGLFLAAHGAGSAGQSARL